MKKIVIGLGVILLLFLVSVPTMATYVWDWKTYQTNQFTIFYPKGYDYQARQTLYYLEKYNSQIDDLTGNKKDKHIYVVIQDVGLLANGYANPVQGKINLYTTNPMTDSVLNAYESWERQVNVHEYTHISQMTNNQGLANGLTTIFGQLFSPNLHVPAWISEGIAVYNESQISPHEGRLNYGYFDTLLASKAVKSELPTISQANYFHNHFPRGQWYLYGGTFFRYVANTYGEESFAQFFNEYGTYYWSGFFSLGDMFPALGIDKAAQEVYGKTFPELFTEWRAYERRKNKDYQVEGACLVNNQGGDIKDITAVGDKLYYYQEQLLTPYSFYYQQWSNLVEYDLATNSKQVIDYSLQSPHASLQIVNHKIYYARQEIKPGFANVKFNGEGRIATLYSRDLRTKTQEKIVTDNFRDFVVLKGERIVYAKQNKDKFGSEIWQYHHGQKEKLGTVAELISELKVWQDKIIVVSKENLGAYGIKILKMEPQLGLKTIIDTEYLETNININDNKVYFNANYDGVMALYQYDLETDQLAKLVNHGIKGIGIDEHLYYTTASASGTSIYKQKINRQNINMPDRDRSTSEIKLSELEIEAVKKDNGFIKSLAQLAKPGIRFAPYLLGGEDALGINSYSITYSPYGGLDFYLNSNLVLPLKIGYVKQDDQTKDRKTYLSTSVPIYAAGYNVQKTLSVGYYTDFGEDVLPEVKLNFKHPHHEATIRVQADVNDAGVNNELTYAYLSENSSFVTEGTYFSDFETNLYLGGFEFDELEDGYYWSGQYNHKLAEIRAGMWNPNVFIGDIYGSFYLDYVKEEQLDFAEEVYGAELSLEVGMANMVHVVPKIGVSVCDDKVKEYLSLKLNF